jgi:hypothetical protein
VYRVLWTSSPFHHISISSVPFCLFFEKWLVGFHYSVFISICELYIYPLHPSFILSFPFPLIFPTTVLYLHSSLIIIIWGLGSTNEQEHLVFGFSTLACITQYIISSSWKENNFIFLYSWLIFNDLNKTYFHDLFIVCYAPWMLPQFDY